MASSSLNLVFVTCLVLAMLSPAHGSYLSKQQHHAPQQQCHTEYDTVTSYEQQCSTSHERECSNTYEQQCSISTERACNTVDVQECTVSHEKQCTTTHDQP